MDGRAVFTRGVCYWCGRRAADVYYAGEFTLQFDVTVSGDADGWHVERLELLTDGSNGVWAYSKWSVIPKDIGLYTDVLAVLAESADHYDEVWAAFLESEGVPPFDPHVEYGTDNMRRL